MPELVIRSRNQLEVFRVTGTVAGTIALDPVLDISGAFRSFRLSTDNSVLIVPEQTVFSIFAFNSGDVSEPLRVETGEWTDYSVGGMGRHLAVVDGCGNLRIYNLSGDRSAIWEGSITGGSGIRAPKWSADERLFAFSGKNELCLVGIKDSTKKKFRLEGLTDFSLSPKHPDLLCVFMRAGDQPAAIVMLRNGDSVSRAALFRADRAEMQWSGTGDRVLVTVTADVDQSGQSYYGESQLFLLSTNNAVKVHLDREGPVHDVCWSPDGASFTVIYGYMPAAAARFDGRTGTKQCAISDATTNRIGSKNTVRLCSGGLSAYGGFGNLPGRVEIWRDADSHATAHRIGQFEASGASRLEWLIVQDEPFILTATTHPRLRVDNNFKIWRWSGGSQPALIRPYKELYQVELRTDPGPVKVSFDDAAVRVAARVTSGASKKEAYRPPSLRPCTNSPIITQPSAACKLSKEEKVLKRLEERLDQITELKARRARGEQLEVNQLDKVAREAEVRKELDALKKMIGK